MTSKKDQVYDWDIYQHLQKLIEQSNPPDNSAPLQPLIDIGHYVNKHWHVMQRIFMRGARRNELSDKN